MVAGLRRLLKRGLPVTGADAVVLALRGVVARAVDPADEVSRTAALDGTLRGLLARFDEARYAPAARALFGLPPAEPGRTSRCAGIWPPRRPGTRSTIFRKRVEPKLIEKVAWEVLADADRFTRSAVIAPRLAPATTWQPVLADPFAWEVAEHEEQLSRLWSALYAARAELLAIERLISLEADRTDIVTTAVSAAWRWAAARAEVISYSTAFAPDADTGPDELIALAGWTPDLTPAQTSRASPSRRTDQPREQHDHRLSPDRRSGRRGRRRAAPLRHHRRSVLGKDDLIAAIHAAGIPCMAEEPGREIYRKHPTSIDRHIRGDPLVEGMNPARRRATSRTRRLIAPG